MQIWMFDPPYITLFSYFMWNIHLENKHDGNKEKNYT